MTMTQRIRFLAAFAVGAVSFGSVAMADEVIAPASQRFASKEVSEVPNFQQHVVPLLSRMGCNGRACHGSFQGQGGFRLSLFGYDFKLDHEGLAKGDADKKKEPRVLVEEPEESLALLKATLETPHRGGKRMAVDSWQYNIFRNWIKDGAKTVPADAPKFVKLEVTPKEIRFGKSDETVQMKAVAVWSNGTQEDVTPLCRFNSNDDVIAAINADGLVKAGEVGDTHVVVNYDQGVVPIPVLRPVSDKTGKKYPKVETPTKIDELIVEKLAKLGVIPSDVCDDNEFLRRVSLDLAGTLPSPQEVTAFLSDTDSNKRTKKIDELLERPGYVAWWTTKICDFTGNNPTNLQVNNGYRVDRSQEWYDWVSKRVAANDPYDKLIEGIVTAVSRKPDESYEEYCERLTAMYGPKKEGSYADEAGLTHFWARRNFQKTDERAIGFAYTFMGIRIQCAQCHKHPFDQWTQDDFNQFTGFFKGTSYNTRPQDKKAEAAMRDALGIEKKMNNGDQQRLFGKLLGEGKVIPFQELYTMRAEAPKPAKKSDKDKDNGKREARLPPPPSAKLLGSDVVVLSDHDDVRVPLMDWLRSPKNPYFAKAFVNRVWANYFNVGIVQPVDDMSLANAPSNAALLNYLAQGFIEHNFDMKWLHREICNSATYQRSWKPNETNRLDQKNFSHAIPRRLPAEVALDALKQATLSDAEISGWLASNKGHMTAIPGSINARGNANGPGFALTVFGRSTRESNCDCDRSMEASLLQTVYLQNDDDVAKSLDDGKGWIRTLTATSKRPEKDTASSDADVAKARAARKNFEKLLSNADRDLKKAHKAEKADEVKELEKRIAELKEKIQKSQAVVDRKDKKSDDKPAQTEVASLNSDDLIKAAYLRTLSRLPSDSEIDTAKKFLTQAETPVAGARDLLWALINTKEFIVNH